jgi:hypothetical protein
MPGGAATKSGPTRVTPRDVAILRKTGSIASREVHSEHQTASRQRCRPANQRLQTRTESHVIAVAASAVAKPAFSQPNLLNMEVLVAVKSAAQVPSLVR